MKYENITRKWDPFDAKYQYTMTSTDESGRVQHYFGDYDWAIRNAKQLGLEVEGSPRELWDLV